MPREAASPLDRIIRFFMSAPLAQATTALQTARTIVKTRLAEEAEEAESAPVRRRRGRGKAKTARRPQRGAVTQVAGAPVPGSTQDTSALPPVPGGTTAGTAAAGPRAVPGPAPRRRRGRPDAAAAAAHTVPTALPADGTGASLPATE